MLAATGRRRRALARLLAEVEGRPEAVDSSVECLICLASAFDMSKAKSKWFQCRAGHLLCETCCNTVSGTAPYSACTLPMGASLTTSMGSIRCRALEAVVEMLLLDVEETRDAACQADGWIEADQTTSCPTLTGDIAESTVAWAGDEGGDCTGPVPLAALARAPRYVPQEQLLPASGCDQASPLTSLQDRNELVSTAPPSLPTLQPSLMRVEPAAAHALGEPVEPLVPAIEQVEDLPTNLQERDELGNTALHWASKRGLADTVRRLIESGGKALLFATTWNGRTALHDAAARGQADVVGLLCDAGGCELLWVANADGNTALHLAACGGHCAVLELLVEAGGKELLFAKNLKGHTALHSASVKGRMEASRLLAAAGGKELLLAADTHGNTALHLAARFGHFGVVELLVEAGGKELLFSKGFEGMHSMWHRSSTSWRLLECLLPLGARSFSWLVMLTATQQFTSRLLTDMSVCWSFWWRQEVRSCCLPRALRGAQRSMLHRSTAKWRLLGCLLPLGARTLSWLVMRMATQPFTLRLVSDILVLWSFWRRQEARSCCLPRASRGAQRSMRHR